MDTTWKQVNIDYPGRSRHEREHNAVPHLHRVLPAAETAGLITAWWFIRKGPWRIRYLPATPTDHPDPLHRLLTQNVPWTHDIYEPETHTFGGPAAMDTAHTLFHHDSHHLLTYLHHQPTNRREHSLILNTALMRAAGLDLNEQADVWARAAQHRAEHLHPHPAARTNPAIWKAFTAKVRHLLLGNPHHPSDWHTAFAHAGTTLAHLRATGTLTRGLRAVITEHVIFHWNRIGLPATTQATLAHAATEALLGSTPPRTPDSRTRPPIPTRPGAGTAAPSAHPSPQPTAAADGSESPPHPATSSSTPSGTAPSTPTARYRRRYHDPGCCAGTTGPTTPGPTAPNCTNTPPPAPSPTTPPSPPHPP